MPCSQTQPDLPRALVASLRDSLSGEAVPGLDELIKPPGGSAERVSCFTFVRLDDGAVGLAFNLLESPETRERYDRLDQSEYRGRSALEVAEELLDPDPVRRIVGYAACSALSQLLFGRGKPAVDTGVDLFDLLDPQPRDHVGVVGYAPPMVRRIAKLASEVTVVEKREGIRGGDNTRVTTVHEELRACNKVLITSTTLLNGTLGELAEITGDAGLRALYGPGAGILPTALFEHGFHAVAGLLVTDPQALVERQRTGKRWGDAKRKFVLRAPG